MWEARNALGVDIGGIENQVVAVVGLILQVLIVDTLLQGLVPGAVVI